MEINKRKEYLKSYYQNNKEKYKKRLLKYREKKLKPKTEKYLLNVLDSNGNILISKKFMNQREICQEINLRPYQVCRIFKKQLKHPNFSIILI